MIKIVSYRKMYKVKQQELADYLEISTKSLGNKENGSKEFTRKEMLQITEFFKRFDDKITVLDIFF